MGLCSDPSRERLFSFRDSYAGGVRRSRVWVHHKAGQKSTPVRVGTATKGRAPGRGNMQMPWGRVYSRAAAEAQREPAASWKVWSCSPRAVLAGHAVTVTGEAFLLKEWTFRKG